MDRFFRGGIETGCYVEGKIHNGMDIKVNPSTPEKSQSAKSSQIDVRPMNMGHGMNTVRTLIGISKENFLLKLEKIGTPA